MKILQVVCGGKWSGVCVMVAEFVGALTARGDEVWTVCVDKDVAARFEQLGARSLCLSGWSPRIRPSDVWPLTQLWTLCLRERFDLVVTHTSKGGFLGRLAARLAFAPAILHTSHGFSFSQDHSPAALRFYRAFEWMAARFGHGSISVSAEHRQFAIDAGVERAARICAIPNGIDPAAFEGVDRERARRKFGFARDETVIGGMGRLAAQKGFEDLIAAFSIVARTRPRARLAIAGDGPLLEELHERARRMQVAERVLFTGFRNDTPEFLAACDLFVQPSHREGFSLVNVEAMMSGLPIVATDIRGNREQIFHQETGLLTAAKDPCLLAGAVERLLRDPWLAARLGENAKRLARREFTAVKMVERHLRVYDEMVRRRRAGLAWNAQEAVAASGAGHAR